MNKFKIKIDFPEKNIFTIKDLCVDFDYISDFKLPVVKIKETKTELRSRHFTLINYENSS